MLVILLSWIIILITNYLLGFIAKKMLKLKVGFSLQVLLGLILTSFICSSVAFFYPINNIVLIGITILSITILVRYYSTIQSEISNQIIFLKKPLNFSIILLASICLSAYSSGYSKINDDGLYYIQTIMWLKNYGFVHGLSNLHVTLGLCSSWHILQALFTFSETLNLNDLNGFIVLLYIFYGLENKSAANNIFSIAQLLIITIISIPFLSAPNPDLAIIVLSAISFDLFYNRNNNNYSHLILLIAVFAISIKLSAITISLLGVFSLYLIIKTKVTTSPLYFAFVSLIITTILFKNIYQTGYILYPYKTITLSQIDYTTPTEIVDYYVNGIKTWGISDKYSPNDIENLKLLNTIDYIIKLITRGGFKAIINICILLIGVHTTILLLKLLLKKDYDKHTIILHATNLIGIIIWLILAPQYRFALPILIFYLAYIASFIFTDKILNTKLLFVSILSMFILTITGFSIGGNNTSKYIGQIEKLTSQHLVKPLPQYYFSFDTLNVNNQTYSYTKNNRYCWNAPIPCLPKSYENAILKHFKYTLVLRNKDLNSGFKYIRIQ